MDLIHTGVDFEIGTVIEAVGPPTANWKCADGSVLNLADYPQYVASAKNLHPKRYERLYILNERTYRPLSCARKGNIIVVVGLGTEVLYTTDGGANWTVNTPLGGTSASLYYNVVCDGTTFVTMRYGTDKAYTSTDGINWTERTMTQSKNWDDLVYDGTYFVALSTVTSPTPIDYSTDGINWYAGTPADNNWDHGSSAAGNGYLVYMDASDKWRRSDDGGQTWEQSTDTIQWLSREYWGFYPDQISFDGTYFNMWFGGYSSSWFLRSSDGFNWEKITFTNSRYDQHEFNPHTTHYDGEKDIICFQGYSYYYPIWFIADGDIRDWEPRITNIAISTRDNRNRVAVIPEKGMFIVGYNGSTDVEAWADYAEYDATTKFQLPSLSNGMPGGLKKYIKVS